MNHHYLITTIVTTTTKEGDTETHQSNMFAYVYPSEEEMTFTKSVLLKLEAAAVRTFCESNNIDMDSIESSASQLIAVSYLGKFETFDDVSKTVN